MKIGVCVGSFDPITKGHQDIIERASKLVDKLVVVVMNNPKKKYWFNLEERKNLISLIYKDKKNIEIDFYTGLVADYMKKNSYELLIKGVRDIRDFSDEISYFYANKELADNKLETIFIPSDKKYISVSSTFVKEIANYSYDLSEYVDKKIIDLVEERANKFR
ncbi:MAG: pantetheine-phosphate adenylyltransferase [Fusobacterium sp.]|nr:pantetheine-phosphate adenylyltransferase [Fusobacterium sp.]